MTEQERIEFILNDVRTEEIMFCDRKQDLYGDLLHTEKVAEFIRDVIAMANTARRFNRICRIVLGIADHPTKENEDIRIGINEPLESHFNGSWDKYRAQVAQIIGANVNYQIHHIVWHVVIDHKQFGCIEIFPDSPPTVYAVSRDYPSSRKRVLSTNDAWIRHGESKRKIKDGDWIHSWRSAPYIRGTNWRTYFSAVLNEPRVLEASAVAPYQDLFVIEGTALEQVLHEFLQDIQRQLLVVKGVAGCGKTVALLRFVRKLLDDADHAIEVELSRHNYLATPPSFVPVIIPLNLVSGISSATELINYVLAHFNAQAELWSDTSTVPPRAADIFTRPHFEGFDDHTEGEQKSDHPAVNWLFVLDGYDEIRNARLQRELPAYIVELMNRLPQVKIIVSSRPDTPQEDWSRLQRSSQVEVAPLSEEQVINYLSARIDRSLFEEYLETFFDDHDLKLLVRRPLFLNSFAYALDSSATQTFEGETSVVESSLNGANLELWEPKAQEIQVESTETVPTAEMPIDSNAIESIIGDVGQLELTNTITDEPIEIMEGEEESDTRIRVGVVLDQVFQRIWKREVSRFNHTELDEKLWWNGLSKLALMTDGNQEIFTHDVARRTIGTRNALQRVLGLGLLEHRSMHLMFVNWKTKVCFAAFWIRDQLEGNSPHSRIRTQLKTLSHQFRTDTQLILSDITTEDLTQLFEGDH